MIDKATIQKIQDTADIVEVVSDYVHLIRRGRNYMGLCPFHNERTPSFSVNKQRNFCYCFSCHKGGNPVNFIMQKEGISYYDALRHLAAKYGIKIQEKELTDEERQRISERESMLVANEWTMRKWQSALTDTEEGRAVGLAYFRHRGVTDDAIKAFRLGYSPERTPYLVEEAIKEGYDIEMLKQLGILGTSKNGRDYDRYYGRVIFPIFNSAGKTIAFGGRLLKDGLAKYINSPETSVYTKSNELYGLYQAKNAIGREDKCYLVEGYMDVIGMWQCGMQNVLSSSGTALTDGQIALIHRFTENVTLIYDGDAAGIKASLRGIDMLLSHKMKVKVLLLPDGDDPDSFARKHSPEEFRAFVAEHEEDILKFKARVLLADCGNDPRRRSDAIRSMVNSIACIPDNIERNIYIQECSKLLNVAEKVIAVETAKVRRALIESWRRQKEHERISRDEKEQEEVKQQELTGNVAGSSDSSSSSRAKRTANLLEPFEREVIRYCVRYGMMPLCDIISEKEVAQISVIDYVFEETSCDDIEFSVDIYKRVFETISAMRDDFNADIKGHYQTIESMLAEMKKEGYEKIANAQLDMSGIGKAEQELEERIQAERQRLVDEFIIDYPARKLSYDEHDDIRQLTTELMTEKYHLSKYHFKGGRIETEVDRLTELVQRSILEWKYGIIKKTIDDSVVELKEALLSNDTVKASRLQQKIIEYSMMRKELSQQIGERIVAP